MSLTNRNDMFDADEYRRLDAKAIAEYNRRYGHWKGHFEKDTIIRDDIGPSPYDGDVGNAPVVVLMANPGWDEDSVASDHSHAVPGWPIAALHESARDDYRQWYLSFLGDLATATPEDLERISRRLAIIQYSAWASPHFMQQRAKVVPMPSSVRQFALARKAYDDGRIVIIGRCANLWCEALEIERGTLPECRPAIGARLTRAILDNDFNRSHGHHDVFGRIQRAIAS